MVTLVLASFESHRYCYLHFQSLSAFYGILNANHLTSLTNPPFLFSASVARASASLVSSWTHFCVQAWESNWSVSLLYSMHLIFFRRKCIEKSYRKLISNKPTYFPDFANIKDFPWLFSDLETFSFFRDPGNPVSLLSFTGAKFYILTRINHLE